jgi:1,4-dihydroxy-2-naphthoate octaprenyltransferase
MPVYLFALGISPNFTEKSLLWSFLIIHLLLYPASNGYNSYFDKDEKSIGGLRNPPSVSKNLFYISLILDLIAIILAYVKISLLFATMILIYGLVSKAYSHPMIRLKKYPIIGWLTVGIFQGFFTFLMSYVAINNFEIENLLKAKVLIPASLSSLILLGSYPMTQIYQHQEDAKHGDKTISMLLGIKGTFIFVQTVFAFAALGYFLYFKSFHDANYGLTFLISLLPVVLFFMWWYVRSFNDISRVNYSNTMWLNFISATCLNGFFIYFFFETSQVGQYL